MKTLAAALFFVGVLSLQGCTYVPAVERTDLSVVHEGAVTRIEIEAVLGEPVESRVTNEGSISIYLYDRGAEGGFEEPFGSFSGCNEIPCVAVLPFIWAYTPFLYADKVEGQEGYLGVVYSGNDTVSYYYTGRHIDGVVQQLQFRERAAQGDPEAQWRLALSEGLPGELWLCRAAHGGDAAAQHRLGRYYHYGKEGVEADRVTAFIWYSLSASSGNKWAADRAGKLAQEMPPSEIAEAERQVAEWVPNPAECETIGAQAEN